MGYLLIAIWLFLLPIIVGSLFVQCQSEYVVMKQWIYGQFMLWALFQVITVPLILEEANINQVITRYQIVVGVFGLLGMLFILYRGYRKQHNFVYMKEKWKISSRFGLDKITMVFFAVLLLQFVAYIFLAVNDGDDAYYMSIANIAQSGGNMYTVNPYSVGALELNLRYALAPFSIWIAFLSRISGVHILTIGHIILGIYMLSFFYAIHYLLANELLEHKYSSIRKFMLVLATCVIWGNTSSHTAASFLITRSRQGKALVASIVLPMMWLLMTDTIKKLQKQERIPVRLYFLVTVVILSGSLGSSMGGTLCIILWGSFCLFCALYYKRISLLVGGVISSLPASIFVLLYLFL